MVARYNMRIVHIWIKTRNLELLKAFVYSERVVKSYKKSGKTHFTSYVRNIFRATIICIYHGLTMFKYNVVCLPFGSKPPSVFQNPETFSKGHYSLR